MDILEKELEDLIYCSLHGLAFDDLKKRGLDYPFDKDMNYFSQLPLGKAGIADIVGFKINRNEHGFEVSILVIELKRYEVSMDTYIQASRYMHMILSCIHHHLGCYPIQINKKIILIGDNIETEELVKQAWINDELEVYYYSLSLWEGISFGNSTSYFNMEHHTLQPQSNNPMIKIIEENKPICKDL